MSATANLNQKPFNLFRFLLQSLDPVHVGVGGYRLGRVDLPIAREPGTNVPKLPGTSVSGATRHYAALRYGRLQCAGQGGDDGRGHCGKGGCPICYTFGSLRAEQGEEKGAIAGAVRIFDARILLFPVHSMAGPVWITSPETLRDFGLEVQLSGEGSGAVGAFPPDSNNEVKVVVTEGLQGHSVLNLGWLMVKVANHGKGKDFQQLFGNLSIEPIKKLVEKLPDTVKKRTVLVPDDIFGHVVNSNLEVRTSVSIDPETGAAKQGALFSYEAIPRATFFWLDVVENDFRRTFPSGNSQEWKAPIDVVVSGIELFEYMGVGGMGTRGFGRIKKIDYKKVM